MSGLFDQQGQPLNNNDETNELLRQIVLWTKIAVIELLRINNRLEGADMPVLRPQCFTCEKESTRAGFKSNGEVVWACNEHMK